MSERDPREHRERERGRFWGPDPRYWQGGPPPHWQGPPPGWWHARRRKQRFLFGRFAAGCVSFLLLVIAGVALTLFVFQIPLDQIQPRAGFPLVLLCASPFVFFLLLAFIGRQFYRRVGSPVVDIMAAADAVADGDFSVRLSEEDTPGQFGRLKRSFNRMTAELERAEQQRRNMTADIAHELRTPLHIIQGNLEGVLDGVYAADNEHIAATLEETRLLARLVDDLQTLSLAEAGELHLHRQQVPLADLFSDIQTSFSGPAAAAGITLESVLPADEPLLEINVDPDRMEQVLTNLVANAIRYTPADGRITLRAEVFREEDRPDGVRISVQDTGMGIAPEDLPFIFDRFWRADRSRTHQAGTGSGLGLAIARQLVQAHGGRIYAASRLDSGTTFTIEL